MTPNVPANVLYCESNDDGTIGGSHYCLLYLIENLDRAAYKPLVTFYEKHALLPRFEATTESLVLPKTSTAKGGFAPLRRAINLSKFVRRIFWCKAFLKERRIDLLHQNNSVKRHHDWMLAALLSGIPYVAHERGINEEYSWLDRELAKRAKILIPVSCAVMNFMIGGGVEPGNVRVLYDGLDPTRIKPARTPEALRAEYGIRPDQTVVGIVGNVREWKGQETVVRAMIEVVKQHPNTVCFFVGAASAGDAAYKAKLEKMIADAGIGENVRFTGFQSDPASFVNMMSIILHASILPEPFGMVVLEAMAQRKPVIGSREGGVAEMVVHGTTGLTFTPGDSAALAMCLSELLNDPFRAAQMGDAGHARLMESFTIGQYMDGIHRIYRSILATGSMPPDVGIKPGAITAKQ